MLYETVDALMDGICDAVREKEGSTNLVDHQDIPARVKAIKTAYGGTAEAWDIREGKTAWVDGEPVEGILPVCESAFMFPNESVSIARMGTQIVANVKMENDYIFQKGCNINFEINNSRFGDADLSDVVAGKTFTSSAGFQKEGEHVCSSVVVEPEFEVDTLSELHYWEKYKNAGLEETEYAKQTISYRNTTGTTDLSTYSWDTVSYADAYTTTGGKISLVNPSSFVLGDTSDNSVILGKYIQTGYNDAFYFIPEDATIYYAEDASAYTHGEYMIASTAIKLTYREEAELQGYVVTDDSKSYPQSGEQDGHNYVYKGTLGEVDSAAAIQALAVTENGTYTAPAGVDGYSPVTVNVTPEAIPAVDQATPVIEVSTSGLITATATQDGGQVVAGTMSATKQLPTQAATSYTPGVSDQVIPSGTYLTGAQTIKGEPNLLPENIPAGVTLFNVAGTREMSTTDLSDIGKLHFWEKYRVDPTINYVENEKENVSLVVYRYFAGTTTNYHIYYGDTFTFDEETKQFSLSSEGYCNTLDAAQSKLPGKYIRYNDNYGYIYFVPEDAVITQATSSTVGTARSIVISKATQLLANNPLCYVGSEASGTYPENGEHSDGYWYVYRGLLADAISQ